MQDCFPKTTLAIRFPVDPVTPSNLPNFLVIGTQKAGTTWIHQFLSGHPQVYLPRKRKELMFFDIQENFETLGIEGYARYFRDVSTETIIGEATPAYLRCSTEYPEWGCADSFRHNIPRRVRTYLGTDLRLIVSLRNPINRALSAFLHHTRKGRIPDGSLFRDWWRRYAIVHHGFYAAHLRRWEKFYPRSSFFITTYEDLFSRWQACKDMLSFLDATPIFDEAFWSVRVNVGSGFIWRGAAVETNDGSIIATAEDIEQLSEIFVRDVEELRNDWGLDVSRWSNFEQ